MSMEVGLALGAFCVALISLFGRFGTKTEVQANRAENVRQFELQNKKLDDSFNTLMNTANRIEVQTTRTNGRVNEHDGRIARLESVVPITRPKSRRK